MTGENWAAVANIHYRDLYFEALEELCTILKEKRYFETIYQLTGRHGHLQRSDETFF